MGVKGASQQDIAWQHNIYPQITQITADFLKKS